jgi:hypothetical protein
MAVMYEAAASCIGLAVGTPPLVSPFLNDGRLHRIQPIILKLPVGYHLVARRHPCVTPTSNHSGTSCSPGAQARPGPRSATCAQGSIVLAPSVIKRPLS